jgi:hypothetical protein
MRPDAVVREDARCRDAMFNIDDGGLTVRREEDDARGDG